MKVRKRNVCGFYFCLKVVVVLHTDLTVTWDFQQIPCCGIFFQDSSAEKANMGVCYYMHTCMADIKKMTPVQVLVQISLFVFK